MNFEQIWNILENELPKKIHSHHGLNLFIKNRSKFEGWLKVEICDILYKYSNNIVPEKNRIDIVFENWAIELKTVNTNYKYNGINNKTKPITKNILSVLKDIRDLKLNTHYEHKIVIFIVFPLSSSNVIWIKHKTKIENMLKVLKYKEFQFNNNINSILYCGLV